MRLVPGSARTAVYERTRKQSGGSTMANMVAALMFFDGVMPDAATIKARFAAGQTGAPRQACLHNVIYPHESQYMGSVAWKLGFESIIRPSRKSELEFILNMTDVGLTNPSYTGKESDPMATRQARIHRAGTPTWFAIAFTSGSGYLSLNGNAVPTAATGSNQIYFCALGTVGNEDSTADLKLVGGNLEATQTSPIDLSKVPIIANLRIQLR